MPNQVRVLIVLFLLPLLANSQVARFMGRYDVSTVTYVADSTWQLSGTFIDLTGSYTGLSCDTNDKIIQRGYDSWGRIVFDRYRITGIISQTVNDLVVNVRSDYTGGIQNSSDMPFTGSFPIASAVSDTSSLTYRTSMYQNLIDPDYDAALDNLNLYEAKIGTTNYALKDSVLWSRNDARNAMWTKYPDSVGINTMTPIKLFDVSGSQHLRDTLFIGDYGDAIWSVPDASIFTNVDFHSDSARLFARGLQIWGWKLINKDDFVFITNDYDTDYDSSFRINGAGNVFARGLSKASSSDTIVSWDEGTGEFKAIPYTPSAGGTVTSISQGTGMLNSSNPITTTGTVGVDTTFVITRYDTSGFATYQEMVNRDTLLAQYARTRDALKVSKADSNINGSYVSKKYADAIRTALNDSAAQKVYGSGTTNYIPKWTNSKKLGNSLIFDNGTNVGVGTTTIWTNFDVNGTVAVGYGATGISKEGIRFARANDNARFQSIFTTTSGGAAGNLMQFNLHNAVTASSQTTVMTLLGTGVVGIGLINPSQKLDVNGVTKATSFYATNEIAVADGSGNELFGTWKHTGTTGGNTWAGYQAGHTVKLNGGGYSGAQGTYNVGIGNEVLYSNTSGSFNTAVGRRVLYDNTTGNNNVAIGYTALRYNTIGISNTAIGYGVLTSNIANSRSTAIGYNSMYYADDRTTGRSTYNTAVGYEALRGSTTAANNTGQYNTAVGDQAMFSNTSGAYNVGMGTEALYYNTTGKHNTAIGFGSLNRNVIGEYNTAVGYYSLIFNTGSNNTAFGYHSGRTLTTGTTNTFLGFYSGYNASQKNDATNSTAIGANSYTDASNQIVFGDANVTQHRFRAGKVGIGKAADSTLDVNGAAKATNIYATGKLKVDGNTELGGTIKIAGGSPGTGKVLMASDNTGLATWADNTGAIYKGEVDGDDGLPVGGGSALIDGTGTLGWYYACSDAGTYDYGNPSGNSITLAVGDQLYYNGTVWLKIPGAGSYTLPAATASALGGIKVGTSLQINSEVLNINDKDMGDITTSGTGSTWTIDNVNSNVGTYNTITINAKGQATAGSNTDYLDPSDTTGLAPKTWVTTRDTLARTTLRTEYIAHDTLVSTTIRAEYIGHDTLVQQYARTRDLLKVSKADSNINGSYTSKKYVDDLQGRINDSLSNHFTDLTAIYDSLARHLDTLQDHNVRINETINSLDTLTASIYDSLGNIYTDDQVNALLALKRDLNNHDSLSTLDEKSYNSLTDKPTSWAISAITGLQDSLTKAVMWPDTVSTITTAYDLATHVQPISRVTALSDTLLRLHDTIDNYTHKTRKINTTSPLSGGGNLSADRTIAIISDTLVAWYAKMNQWKNDSTNYLHKSDTNTKVASRYWVTLQDYLNWSDTTGKLATDYDIDTLSFLRAFTEVDPIFAGDSAKLLHWSDSIAKIATKYDLDTLGFLRSFTEADPIWISDSTDYLHKSDTNTKVASRKWVIDQGYSTFDSTIVQAGTGAVTVVESPNNTFTVNNTDPDQSTTNEIQNLSWTAATGTMNISSGTGVAVPTFATNSTNPGLVTGSNSAGTSKYLNGNGGWTKPPNTTYSAGYRMQLTDTVINNASYWKNQDTLKTTLTGFVKATAGVLSADNSTYLTGNQTITLSGDVSGSGTTAITATVADDSHNHVISNVDNLQTALDSTVHWTDTNTYIQTKKPVIVSTTLITTNFSDWTPTCSTAPSGGTQLTWNGKSAYYIQCENGDYSGYIEKSIAGTYDSVTFFFDPTGVLFTIELQPYGGGTAIKSMTSSANGWVLFSSSAPVTGGYRIVFSPISSKGIFFSTLTGYNHTDAYVILEGNVYAPGIDSVTIGNTILGYNYATGKISKVAAPAGSTNYWTATGNDIANNNSGTVTLRNLANDASPDSVLSIVDGVIKKAIFPNPAGGSVESVGLALPSQLTVSGSPITTSGTLTATWADTTANKVFAGPTTGTAKPKFRSLVNSDLVGAVKDSTTLTGGTGINITGTRPDYTITNSAPESTTMVSQGDGEGTLLVAPTGTQLNIKSLKQGTGITLTNNANDVTITSTGLANPMDASGDIIYGGVSGTPTKLAKAADGTVLTLSSGLPSWQTIPSGFTNPLTATGDILYRSASNAADRLPIGVTGYVLKSNGTEPVYAAEDDPKYYGDTSNIAFLNTTNAFTRSQSISGTTNYPLTFGKTSETTGYLYSDASGIGLRNYAIGGSGAMLYASGTNLEFYTGSTAKAAWFNDKKQLTFETTNGTAPIITSSTTLNSNLNADLLDGNHASAFQTALTNPVTGTGTSGYFSKFIGTSAIGNSLQYETAGKIGIGITLPSAKLHVVGDTVQTGVYGNATTTGVLGVGNTYGVYGAATTTGVYGAAPAGTGVSGQSTSGIGVQAQSISGTALEVTGKIAANTVGQSTGYDSIYVKDIATSTMKTAAVSSIILDSVPFTRNNTRGATFLKYNTDKVGIRTTTPTTTLDVNGDITIRGYRPTGSGNTHLGLLKFVNSADTNYWAGVAHWDYSFEGMSGLKFYTGVAGSIVPTVTIDGTGNIETIGGVEAPVVTATQTLNAPETFNVKNISSDRTTFLSDNQNDSILLITNSSGQISSGKIHYSIYCSRPAEGLQVYCGELSYSLVNYGGVITSSVTNTALSSSLSTGSITVTPSIENRPNGAVILFNTNSSLTTPTIGMTYYVETLFKYGTTFTYY